MWRSEWRIWAARRTATKSSALPRRAPNGGTRPAGSEPLHRLNPVRLEFIRAELVAHFSRDPRALRPFDGLSLVDIGCGGGLIAEPMARLGFRVVGVDAAEPAIAMARAHAKAGGLGIDYRAGMPRRWPQRRSFRRRARARNGRACRRPRRAVRRRGDADSAGRRLYRRHAKPHLRAFALAIVGAEYVLRWLPRGTHDWRRFVRPSEFVMGLRRHGLAATRLAGLSYSARRRLELIGRPGGQLHGDGGESADREASVGAIQGTRPTCIPSSTSSRNSSVVASP